MMKGRSCSNLRNGLRQLMGISLLAMQMGTVNARMQQAGGTAASAEKLSVAPETWTPDLMTAASTYPNPNRTEKFLKKPSVDSFIRVKSDDPEPADIDPSIRYDIYRNVLGNLTYVSQYRGDGHQNFLYFFNKDGSLAAVERRFDTKTTVGNAYVEYEDVFYDGTGHESQRKVTAYEQGKITSIQSNLSPPRLEKPPFGTFAQFFNSKFKSAESLDADKLGLCYFNLADGYPTAVRVLNFAPQQLDFYRQSSRKMNFARFDTGWVTREPKNGVAQDLGTLDGKRVYSIDYSNGDFHVIVVERQSGRYLPLMYFSPHTKIDQLVIIPSVGRQVLAYSSRISGSGGFTDDWYFILDQGVPKRIDLGSVLARELRRIYPEIRGTRPRGNFDLSGLRRFDVATLTFTSPVWKDEDSNDSPSEKVQVVFQIRNGELVVKSSHREKSTGLF